MVAIACNSTVSIFRGRCQPPSDLILILLSNDSSHATKTTIGVYRRYRSTLSSLKKGFFVLIALLVRPLLLSLSLSSSSLPPIDMFFPQYGRVLTRSVNISYRHPTSVPICARFRRETVAASRPFVRSNSTKLPKFEPSGFKAEKRKTGSTDNVENHESSKGKSLNGK